MKNLTIKYAIYNFHSTIKRYVAFLMSKDYLNGIKILLINIRTSLRQLSVTELIVTFIVGRHGKQHVLWDIYLIKFRWGLSGVCCITDYRIKTSDNINKKCIHTLLESCQ